MIRFEWDENKNQTNIKKHGISFERAKEVFYDDNALLFDDPEHSVYEDRFLIIGNDESSRTCIVSHCYRDDDVIRVISARKATTREKQIYQTWERR